MANKISSEISIQLKALGIYQIAGGIMGFGLIIWLITLQSYWSGFLLFLYLIASALYAFSIFCGVLLLKNKETGLNYSLINQYVQLISFSMAGFAFQYVSGFFVSAGIDLTHSLLFKFHLGVSSWRININSDNEVILVNFNFIALLVIIYIDKLKKKIEEHKMGALFSNRTQEN